MDSNEFMAGVIGVIFGFIFGFIAMGILSGGSDPLTIDEIETANVGCMMHGGLYSISEGRQAECFDRTEIDIETTKKIIQFMQNLMPAAPRGKEAVLPMGK